MITISFCNFRNRNEQSIHTFTSLSDLESDTHTLSITGDYKVLLTMKTLILPFQPNYIDYNNEHLQNVATSY